MALYSTVLTMPTTTNLSNAITLPSNTSNISLFLPASPSGTYLLQLSPDNGVTWYNSTASVTNGSVIPLAGIALLGGNTQVRLLAGANPATVITAVFRYRTEETLNASFLLT